MVRDKLFFLLVAAFCGLVTSQAPSSSEYERAKVAITKMVEDTTDLPTCVRLGT